MGSHTDYNQGYVMTMTIDRDTWIAARPRQDGRVSVQSLNAAGWGDFELGELESPAAAIGRITYAAPPGRCKRPVIN